MLDEAYYQFYKSKHTTLGCRITHMFGIPLIFMSFLSLPLVPVFLTFFLAGWGLQLLGHYVFEKNEPVFKTNPEQFPQTVLASARFAYEEWRDLLL